MHVVRKGFAGGGMENGVINIANGISLDRFRLSICALDSTETFSQRIRDPNTQYHLLPKLASGIDWRLVMRLRRLIQLAKVDVVHSHNWATFLYAVLAAKWAGIAIIHGEHGKNNEELNEHNRPKYWAKRILGRRVESIVTVSHAIADEWAGYRIPIDRIQCIQNGVDTERFRPTDAEVEYRRQFGLAEEGWMFGSVGRFDPIKNYDVLVAAFAQLHRSFPKAHLAFLADGPCEGSLRRLAAELGVADSIYWLGRRSDPEKFLRALDIFVLPSKSEGMSNVVLEAMASGLPVVCADLPGHREVFDPGHEGIVISPCTAETLAAELMQLAPDTQRRTSLGEAARRKVVERFSIKRMIADYERLYAAYGRVPNSRA
jgi:sugar transferase (PEP-CTERM/EpsH1 system associated)